MLRSLKARCWSISDYSPKPGGVAAPGRHCAYGLCCCSQDDLGPDHELEFYLGVKAAYRCFHMLVTQHRVSALQIYLCCRTDADAESPVSLRVRMDATRADECTNCKGCEKACFMNVLPRMNKRDISCVNCGACIAACHKELGKGKGFLISSLEKKLDRPCGAVSRQLFFQGLR